MQPLQLEAAQRHVMMPKKRAASAEKEQQLGGLPKPCLVCVSAPANLRKSTETQAPGRSLRVTRRLTQKLRQTLIKPPRFAPACSKPWWHTTTKL